MIYYEKKRVDSCRLLLVSLTSHQCPDDAGTDVYIDLVTSTTLTNEAEVYKA